MKNFILFFLFAINISAQSTNCELKKSESLDLYKVDRDKLICIAKNSEMPLSVFYTFTSWCAPCRMHMPNVIELGEKYNINFYVLLTESEKDKGVLNAVDFVKGISKDTQMLILDDAVYGKSTRTRNNKFISEISNRKKEFNPGYGVCIVVNKKGEILKVTNNVTDYKKKSDGTWESYQELLNREVVPFLK